MDTRAHDSTPTMNSAKMSFLVGGLLIGLGLATFLLSKKQPTEKAQSVSQGVEDLLKVCQDACYELDKSERGIAS